MSELVDKIIAEVKRQINGQVTIDTRGSATIDSSLIHINPDPIDAILNALPSADAEKVECAEAKIGEIIHWTRRSMGPLCSPIDDGLSYDLIEQKIKTHTAELLALLAPVVPSEKCPVCGCTEWITTSLYGTECIHCLHKKGTPIPVCLGCSSWGKKCTTPTYQPCDNFSPTGPQPVTPVAGKRYMMHVPILVESDISKGETEPCLWVVINGESDKVAYWRARNATFTDFP